MGSGRVELEEGAGEGGQCEGVRTAAREEEAAEEVEREMGVGGVGGGDGGEEGVEDREWDAAGVRADGGEAGYRKRREWPHFFFGKRYRTSGGSNVSQPPASPCDTRPMGPTHEASSFFF